MKNDTSISMKNAQFKIFMHLTPDRDKVFFLQIFEIIDSNYIGIDESSFKYVFESTL